MISERSLSSSGTCRDPKIHPEAASGRGIKERKWGRLGADGLLARDTFPSRVWNVDAHITGTARRSSPPGNAYLY